MGKIGGSLPGKRGGGRSGGGGFGKAPVGKAANIPHKPLSGRQEQSVKVTRVGVQKAEKGKGLSYADMDAFDKKMGFTGKTVPAHSVSVKVTKQQGGKIKPTKPIVTRGGHIIMPSSTTKRKGLTYSDMDAFDKQAKLLGTVRGTSQKKAGLR